MRIVWVDCEMINVNRECSRRRRTECKRKREEVLAAGDPMYTPIKKESRVRFTIHDFRVQHRNIVNHKSRITNHEFAKEQVDQES